jgi:hypothetical protein
MDIDGDPEDDELEKIEKWFHADMAGMMEYIKERWKYADDGYWRRRSRTYWVSTGGWSGNESIIGAMRRNMMFWAMCWCQSNRGGHYKFVLPKEKKAIENKGG